MKRGSGILMHISSLPGPYGIGTLGKNAYQFVDFLEKSGQSYWQILPLGPTTYGDSPYQSFSTFAGNPYFIDFDLLIDEGILSKNDCTFFPWDENSEFINYSLQFNNRFKVLRIAYQQDKDNHKHEIINFRNQNAYWIEDYALYMALKYENDMKSYQLWEPSLKTKEPEAIAKACIRLQDEINFWVYIQFLFFKQWNALKKYANQKGIQIIGDLPIYVAEDSADAWACHEILQLDENRTPIAVAGCPPDYFAEKGQLWGNPLYDWKKLKETGYRWWIQRIRAALSMVDILRIDHFRAFDSYYAIPYGRKDAVIGKWEPGPGKDFFDTLAKSFGRKPNIIAEDLGDLTDSVRELLQYTNFPGMKVLQFAFQPGEDNDYLPHNCPHNSVTYIGTHDNDTLRGWMETQPEEIASFVKDYMRLDNTEGYHIGFIKGLMATSSDTIILTIQDLLYLGTNARMNTPSTIGCNWQWRLPDIRLLSGTLAETLHKITKTYLR